MLYDVTQLPLEFFERFQVIPSEEPRRCGNVGYRLSCYEKSYDVRGCCYLGNEPVVVLIVPVEGGQWEWRIDLPDDSVDEYSVDLMRSAASLTFLIWLAF